MTNTNTPAALSARALFIADAHAAGWRHLNATTTGDAFRNLATGLGIAAHYDRSGELRRAELVELKETDSVSGYDIARIVDTTDWSAGAVEPEDIARTWLA